MCFMMSAVFKQIQKRAIALLLGPNPVIINLSRMPLMELNIWDF
jgi:hypothetical protein